MISRRRLLIGAPAIVLCSSLGFAKDLPRHSGYWKKDRIHGELLIQLGDGVELDAIGPILERYHATVIQYIPLLRACHVSVPRLADDEVLATELENSGLVKAVNPNAYHGQATTPNDPFYSNTSGPQTYLNTINCPAAWASRQLNNFNLTGMIPVVDINSGVQTAFSAGGAAHPDLIANILPGWNVLTGSNAVGDVSSLGHGTLCGGIVAATTNNGAGIASVGWGGSLIPIQATNGAAILDSNLILAMTWILGNVPVPAVINWSFGGPGSIATDMFRVLWNAGYFICASTGDTPQAICLGGATDSPYVLGVTACNDSLGWAAGYATYGPPLIAGGSGGLVCAPGGENQAGFPNDPFWTTALTSTYVSNLAGTSFSSPMWAAAIRFAWQGNPTLSNRTMWKLAVDPANGQATTGFTGVPAPWLNPPCLDINALMIATNAASQVGAGGALLSRR